MKRLMVICLIFITLVSCKNLLKNDSTGSFEIVNLSDKVIEFIWIAPENTFYPTANSVSIARGSSFKLEGIDSGRYDIAIDFKDEYNSFNSKKDKTKLLIIAKDIKTLWYISETGEVITSSPR